MKKLNKRLAELVCKILLKHPEARDSDQKLYAYVLAYNQRIDPEATYTGAEILKAVSKEFDNFESMRRSRCKMQSEGFILSKPFKHSSGVVYKGLIVPSLLWGNRRRKLEDAKQFKENLLEGNLYE